MTHEARRRLVRIVTVCIVIALVIAAGEFSLRIHADRRPPGYATGDPLDIRLTGVWNPVTSEIRDASGNRIGETLGVFGGFQTASPPWMHRNFSFEMSQDADGITFGPCTVSPSGTTRGMIGSGPRDLAPAANSRKRVFVPGSFLRTYDVPHWLSRIVPFLPLPRRKIDVKEVDVTIRWWDGPRGEAAYTFTGPFEASKTYTTGGAAPATLTVSDYSQPAGGWGTRFHFVCPRSSGISCFLVYDRDGNRRNDFCMSGGTRGPAGIDHVYAIAGLARQDISAVTSGEMPRERTFHNIKVACDGPEPEYPPYFDLAAERLGVPYRQGQGFENYNYASGEDIIKVADVLRGNAITYAGHRLLSQVEHRGWYASLPEADRAKLMDVLRQWGASDDPQTRAMAVQIGIVADPEAFVGQVLDLIESGTDTSLSYGVTRHTDVLTAADLSRVRRIILSGTAIGNLVDALSTCPLPEAAEVLVELARRPEPWFWWPALKTEKTRRAAGPFDELDKELKLRVLLAGMLKDAADESLVAEAITLVPGIVTTEFNAKSVRSFNQALTLLAEKCDREIALSVMTDFVRKTRDYSPVIGRIARYASVWYGVDIAGVASVPEDDLDESAFSWRQVALEFLKWRDTGTLGEPVPPGYRAGKGDMRVIWYDGQDGESAGISLWVYEDPPTSIGLPWMILSSDSTLTVSLAPSAPTLSFPGRPAPDYDIDLRARIYAGEHPKSFFTNSDRESFAIISLPVTVKVFDNWSAVIERADSPDSVLSGTKVFADWWAKYGPSTSTLPPSPSEKTEPESTSSVLTQEIRE